MITVCLECGADRFDHAGAKLLDEVRAEGYRAGVERLRKVVEAARAVDAQFARVYAGDELSLQEADALDALHAALAALEGEVDRG